MDKQIGKLVGAVPGHRYLAVVRRPGRLVRFGSKYKEKSDGFRLKTIALLVTNMYHSHYTFSVQPKTSSSLPVRTSVRYRLTRATNESSFTTGSS